MLTQQELNAIGAHWYPANIVLFFNFNFNFNFINTFHNHIAINFEDIDKAYANKD